MLYNQNRMDANFVIPTGATFQCRKPSCRIPNVFTKFDNMSFDNFSFYVCMSNLEFDKKRIDVVPSCNIVRHKIMFRVNRPPKVGFSYVIT
jgi:hypothetical protein